MKHLRELREKFTKVKLPIGTGKVDFNCFFDFIKRICYKGDFTVESTAFDSDGVINVDMLNEQFKYIREKLR